MNIKDKLTIIISILALTTSGVSLYYSNFQKADVKYIVGNNGQIWENENNTISLFIPITFINNSNSVGYVYNSKIKFYPKNSKIDSTFHWNEFWQNVPEKDSTGEVSLINRPISDAYVIPLIGKSQEKKLINFWVNTSKIELKKGIYTIELSILTNNCSNWEKTLLEFQYDGIIDISLNEKSNNY